ncbi:DUF4922 domain-containing protein [Marinilabiliaceae bacterium ANBcel2]|nr:DUF4922 domain-containing protein [Marinilabiliaceae bacterium ANBcel2]
MQKTIYEQTEDLIKEQLENWPMAKDNFYGLNSVEVKEVKFEGDFKVKVQFNPERIRSSSAKVDDKSIKERKCFLCSQNRPSVQKGVDFNGEYTILINPFPIFKKHLTIPGNLHQDQRIEERFVDMLQISRALEKYVVFYNGPKCGASAPDHFHFQAGNVGFLPVEDEFNSFKNKTLLDSTDDYKVYALDNYLRKGLVFTGCDTTVLNQLFSKAWSFFKDNIPSDPEPMVNILTFWEKNQWKIFLFPRNGHRPKQFFYDDPDKIMLSPASVDFGGVLITPRKEDFEKLNGEIITDIFNQVTIDDNVWEKLKRVFSK